MKPPGAPEVPMDAQERKGLIGTKVRGERLWDPGARCVVQFLKNGTFRNVYFILTWPKNMTPDPLTILTATAASKQFSERV